METSLAIMLSMVMASSIWVYLKLNRFFGAVLTILTSLGIMYAETTHAWMGWIIFSIGIMMLLESVFNSSKKNRR